MSAPVWLQRAVLADAARFGLVTAAQTLPAARLGGPRCLALPEHEVIAVDQGTLLRAAVLGLAGPQSPLPAGLAHELGCLDADCAMAGLLDLIEDRLLRLLVQAQVRRAVDDPHAHREILRGSAGLAHDADAAVAGRICDGVTADALAARVALAAGCAVRIEPSSGGRLPLGPGRSQRLGGMRLGVDQVVGDEVPASELGCCIWLGPVDAAQAAGLRPGGLRHNAVLAAVRRGMPPCMTWRLRLLWHPGPAGPALGVDLRLDGPPPVLEREELARSDG